MKTEAEKKQERTEYIHKAIEKAEALVELSAQNAMVEAIAESAYKFISWNQIAEEEREQLKSRIADLEKQLVERDAKPEPVQLGIVGHIDAEKLARALCVAWSQNTLNTMPYDDLPGHCKIGYIGMANAAIDYIREHCAPRWMNAEEAKALGLKGWIWAVKLIGANNPAYAKCSPQFIEGGVYCPLIEISKIKEEVKP